MTTPAQDDILIRERDEARADRDHLIEAIRNACRVAGVSLATPRNPVADIERLGSMARDWWDRGQAAESRHAKSLADARLAAHRDGVLQGVAERDRLRGELAAAHAAPHAVPAAAIDEALDEAGVPGRATVLGRVKWLIDYGEKEARLARAAYTERFNLGEMAGIRRYHDGDVTPSQVKRAYDRTGRPVPGARDHTLVITHGEALVEVPYTTEPDADAITRGGWGV